jgi:hypothetical protein
MGAPPRTMPGPFAQGGSTSLGSIFGMLPQSNLYNTSSVGQWGQAQMNPAGAPTTMLPNPPQLDYATLVQQYQQPPPVQPPQPPIQPPPPPPPPPPPVVQPPPPAAPPNPYNPSTDNWMGNFNSGLFGMDVGH